MNVLASVIEPKLANTLVRLASISYFSFNFISNLKFSCYSLGSLNKMKQNLSFCDSHLNLAFVIQMLHVYGQDACSHAHIGAGLV